MPGIGHGIGIPFAHKGFQWSTYWTKLYKDKVESDGGVVLSETNVKNLIGFYESNSIWDNIKMLLFGEAGVSVRASAPYNYIKKWYDLAAPPSPISGDEKVTNGAFDVDESWTKGASWTISDGVAHKNTGSVNNLSQANVFEESKTYICTFTIKNYVSGSVHLRPNTGAAGISDVAADGTYTVLITPTTGNTTLIFVPASGTVLDIDDVSVKEYYVNDGFNFYQTYQPISNSLPTKRSFLNKTKSSQFFNHHPIVFANEEPWSITTVVNWSGDNNGASWEAIYGAPLATSMVALNYGTRRAVSVLNTGTTSIHVGVAGELDRIVGKISVITIVANGSGGLKIYINGILKSSQTGLNTAFTAGFLMMARTLTGISARALGGEVFLHKVTSDALSYSNVLAEYNKIKEIYDELPVVTLGGLSVVTINLNVIQDSIGTLIADGTVDATWIAGNAAWCYHPSAVGIEGKLYNKAARDIIVANPPIGYHVASEAELTSIATNGGNVLKIDGTGFWSTAGGINSSGFNAVGGASRNADGTFNTWKETVSFWCADSDKALLLHHDSDVAEIVAAAANEGHYIRLIKDAEFSNYSISDNEVVFTGTDENIRVLIVADLHLGSYDDVGGLSSINRLKYCIQCLNTEHASSPVDFVVFIGDFTERAAVLDGESDYVYLNLFLEFARKLKMPYFFVNGGHDAITSSEWAKHFNYLKNYSIKFGDYAFVLVDNFETYVSVNPSNNIDSAWLTSVLAKYNTEQLFMMSHYGMADENMLDSLYAKPNLVCAFHGHLHEITKVTARNVDSYGCGTFGTLEETGWCFRELEYSEGALKTSVIYVEYPSTRSEADEVEL